MADIPDKQGRERTGEHEAPPSPSRGAAPEPPPLMHREMTATRRVLHPLLRAVIFGAGAFVFTSFLTGLFLWFFRLSPYTYQGWPIFLLYLLLDLMLLALSWLCLELFDQREFATLGLWFYPGWGRETAWGVAGSAALMTVIVGAMVVARGLSYAGINHASGIVASIFSLSGFLLLAAAFEEIAFRGYAFQRLVDAVGPLGSVAISAALFGAAHLKNPSATPLSTANTVLAGVLFSVAYLRTRALWLPISLHWAWNFFQGPVFSLPVSGVFFQPTLFRAQLAGKDWLTGGSYGPEGGAVVTVVCVLAICWLARSPRLAPSPAMTEVLK